ncbi:hypothetical protein [Proteiniclasticum sp.]|uniref:hypothetical protein n=1 Tax=Proteiniclasticum sp. TaxID=2053595 RepID=UPI0028A0A557|nr:hypothetical protein [Proteiniclasticum sp.]
MAEASLVESLRKMSDAIIKDQKSVNLIMLLGDNYMDQNNSFDYVISAKWLDKYKHDKGIDLILDYLFEYLTIDDRKHISRVMTISTTDPIVQNITRNMGVQGGVAYNIDCRFGDLIIPFAIIFESQYPGK